MGGELLSFDEALAELQMATHELRSLVAQGEIRAFRDEDVLKFRRTDILDLKKSRDTHVEGMLIEPGDVGDEELPVETTAAEEPAPGPEVKPVKHETEETELLTGIGQDKSMDFLGLDEAAGPDEVGSDTAQTVVPTIEIADEDMIDETTRTVVPSAASDETDVLGAEETAVSAAPALLADEDEATEMATQELVTDEARTTSEAAEVGAATVEAATEAPLRFQDAAAQEELGISTEDVSATAGVTTARRAQMYRAEAAMAPAISPVFFVIALVTFVVLLLSLPVFYGIATDSAPNLGPYKALLDFLRQQWGG